MVAVIRSMAAIARWRACITPVFKQRLQQLSNGEYSEENFEVRKFIFLQHFPLKMS